MGKTDELIPEQFAADWYPLLSVTFELSRSGDGDIGSWDAVPSDVHSHEFAVWLTGRLQYAMSEGIEVGQLRKRRAALAKAHEKEPVT